MYAQTIQVNQKMVVIIDAKHKLSVHAVAQIIGYYSVCDITNPPPLAAVLTDKEIQFVFFKSGANLINVIVSSLYIVSMNN